ncbi:MAG: molybdopterin-dependent oxidoreductase [Mycobacterium sp.]|nr:molybdopterin-dependent oxidoreductase [Mycobacterium sp.]
MSDSPLRRLSRRTFLAGSLVAGAALAAWGRFGTKSTTLPTQPTDPTAVGVGAPRRRQDVNAKVRGEFEYAPDLSDRNMLWGATVRSVHPHALIRNVNLDAARTMPGVKAVLIARDVPRNSFGLIRSDTPVLADDRVRYVGEPIAIVAAEDPVLARRAADAVEVEYKPLPAVLDPVAALEAGAVYRHVKFTHGDPDIKGEVQAEGEYFTARQDHAFLAPDAGIARPDGRGGVEIIGAAQWVHADRPQIAAALGLPEEMVLVRNSGIGGAFGGRVSMTWQLHGALLALHTGRPVKFLYTRQETMLARYHRHPSRIWVRHHATRDGRLVKLEAKILLEDGPYMHAADAGIGNSCSMIQGPYAIPNAAVEGWSVATNNGMCGSMRGFGVVEPMFACESNMDNLARTLGMDGAQLRRINAIQRGDRWIFNQLQDRPTPTHPVMETADRMPLPADVAPRHPVDLPGGVSSPARREYVRRAVGYAAATKNVCLSEGAPVNSTAVVTLRDGEAVIECAAAEVGQGFVGAAVQIAQSTLGVTKVQIGGASTALAPAATTDGQQQTMTSGPAIDRAAGAVKEQLLSFYGREHQVDPTELDIREDYVVDRSGRRLMSVAEAGAGREFRATGRFEQRRTRRLEDLDSPDPMHVTLDFSANRCVVDVDAELGLVKVIQMDVAQDVGKAVNPVAAHYQIAGGSVMGMGLALMEHLQVADGHPVNTDFSTYMIPTAVDVPVINTRFVEEPEPGISYGIKGMGELPHVQAPPAVLSALRAATGRELSAAPATAGMLAGIAALKKDGAGTAWFARDWP